MFGDNKEKMHPEDTRNLVIFFIIAAILYFTYDALILKPQTAALRQKREVEMQAAQNDVLPVAASERPREQVIAETGRVRIENGKIYGSLSLVGARIDDISLRDHYETIEKKKNVFVLSPKETEFPRHMAVGWVAENNLKVPDDSTVWTIAGNSTLTSGAPVTLAWENGQGLRFENTYSIDDAYLITVKQKIINNSGTGVALHPYGLIAQTGLHPDFAPIWVVHEGPVGFVNNELHQLAYRKMQKEPQQEFSGTSGWAGITDKYWLTGLIPVQGMEMRYRYTHSGNSPQKRGEKDQSKYQVDYTGAAMSVASGQSLEFTSNMFVGAKEVLMLESYGKKLNLSGFDLAVDFGWFWFLSKPFFFILHYMAAYSNIAIAMITLTIIIRLAVFPLTNISYKSFAKMKKVGPQVNELRKVHGSDKVKLQEELVKLYEREGVNPMSGCLPMFVQIPIFFALYKVLVNTIEMRQAPFFGWIKDMSAPDPTNIFNLFGVIDWNPPSFMHVGIWPCLMLVCFLIQKQLNPPPQDPIQRDMAVYFPFLMAYMMGKFASGLVIYWTLGAMLGIIQQIYIMRSLGVPIYLFGEKEDPVPVMPGVHPLVGLAEKEAEEALFGDGTNGDSTSANVSAPKPRRKKKK